jgi:glycosyltransferase involved in cell wall biosynthesis
MVTLVVTIGSGSLDIYSKKLAENLDVPKLYTDIYQRVAERFKVPLISGPAISAALEDWRFVRQLNRTRGVVHLPNHHLARYGLFTKVPYILTVHDLIRYFDLKGYRVLIHRPNLRDKFYLSLDYKGIKKATRIIAVSHSTKRDLVQHLSIPEERIRVVYEGVDHQRFRPVARKLFDFPYILYVGSEHPRKNLVTLLRAFGRLKREARFRDIKLVKVGKAGGPEADFRGQTLQAIRELNLSGDVVFTGYVPERDLPAYYSGALCFVLPSFYEGFGLPVLEAMACGCPVVVSRVSSLPEVGGEAAIYINPNDPEDLAGALRQVATDEGLRRDMSRRGFEQARRFSWKHTAQETLEVYREVERELDRQRAPSYQHVSSRSKP